MMVLDCVYCFFVFEEYDVFKLIFDDDDNNEDVVGEEEDYEIFFKVYLVGFLVWFFLRGFCKKFVFIGFVFEF